MKKIDYFFTLVLVGILVSCSQPNDEYTNHENDSKSRYIQMQKELNTYVEKRNVDSLRFLAAELDAQLKLEDFLIRFRQVDSVKFTLSGPLITGILTAIVSVTTTLLTLFYAKKKSKSSL
jgi:hypothetical protein